MSANNKPVVVIVDDQPSVCKEVASFLSVGYSVVAFKSGKEVLSYLEKNTADIILMDYYMPEMTGFEALLAIRQRKSSAEIPIIFLTSETNDRLKREMKERGANDYLCKPIDSTLLRETVKRYAG